MDLDYSMYAQLSGLSLMPTPQEFYPEIRGGMQQQQPQQGGDFDRGSSQMSTYQPPPAPVQDRYHHGTADMYDGLQAGSYSPGRYQCSSPSEYRCMMKEQKRAKEMMSRNGLHSPMETSARYSGGDANYYSNYAESNRQSRPGGGNSYW